MERRFYAIEIAYDGGAFRGYQRQPGLPTVQDVLERALAALGLRVPLAVAARTDAGVHAIRQIVSFSVRAEIDPEELRRGLNATLPEEVLAIAVHRVPSSFHARSTALSRTYVYLVAAPAPHLLRRFAWSLPDPRAFPGLPGAQLDAERMRATLAETVGTHDFAGFARPGEQRGTVRTILRAEMVTATWGPVHAIVLEGRGFLRAMVRNLVGTVVAAGIGVAQPGAVRDIIAARARYRGVRAPGWGLTLAGVRYPAGALPQGDAGPSNPPGGAR